MNMTFADQLNEIRARMQSGEFSYKEAQEKAAPILASMNERMKAICKEYGKKHKDITFGQFMR